MKSWKKPFFKSISILMLTAFLFANSQIFGQLPAVEYFTDVATADINSAIFLRPDTFGDVALVLGTNKGKSMLARINPSDKLTVKPTFKTLEFLQKSEDIAREIIFTSTDKGYLLRSNGIFFSDGNSNKWSILSSPLDFGQSGNAILQLWGMSFVGKSQRVCVAGIYVKKTGTVSSIDKELLSCTDNISVSKPEWDVAKMDWLDKEKPIYLTNIYFNGSSNGWAVGIDGTEFKKGIIWQTTDGGKNWKEQDVKIDAPLLSVGGTSGKTFAIGFNGTVFASGMPLAATTTNDPNKIEKGDTVEIQPGIFQKIKDLAETLTGNQPVTKIIGTVKDIRKNGMLKVEVTEILPKSVSDEKKEQIREYFDDNEVAPKNVKEINNSGGETISNSWQAINVNVKETLRSIKFDDEGKGFIVGDKGTILYSANGGDKWTKIPAAQLGTIDLYSIFLDKGFCWIGGSKGAVARIKYK